MDHIVKNTSFKTCNCNNSSLEFLVVEHFVMFLERCYVNKTDVTSYCKSREQLKIVVKM